MVTELGHQPRASKRTHILLRGSASTRHPNPDQAVMIHSQEYRVADPEAFETPAMLVFRDIMEHNIRSACEMVGGGENLFVHVKTHKSEAVVRAQIRHGIDAFKCATLRELEMVLEAGARRAILAYPQVQRRKLERLSALIEKHPNSWIATIASDPRHVKLLAGMAEEHGQIVRVMLDLDAGMHRTGIGFGADAEHLYRQIDATPSCEPVGLHLYDGHDERSDPQEREAVAQEHIEALRALRQRLESAGMPVPFVVAGCSYSFPYYARTDGMCGSPGTFVYWDVGFREAMPDRPFRCAALILTQVVDRYPDEGLITTDLGYKAVSSDLPEQKRAYLVGHDKAQLVQQSEEHGVFRVPGDLPEIGDYLLAAPGHICPTTIRYPGSHVINAHGDVVDYFLHTARDRQ